MKKKKKTCKKLNEIRFYEPIVMVMRMIREIVDVDIDNKYRCR